MSKLAEFQTRWSSCMLSVLRIMSALLFLQHGTQKMFNFPPRDQPFPDPLPPIVLAAGLLELVGGILLAIGLFTRSVSFVLSGMMAVAYFMSHATRGFYPILNGGDLAILFCFVFLYFFLAGGGNLSADALIARKKVGL